MAIRSEASAEPYWNDVAFLGKELDGSAYLKAIEALPRWSAALRTGNLSPEIAAGLPDFFTLAGEAYFRAASRVGRNED